jgi:hypothetical protein
MQRDENQFGISASVYHGACGSPVFCAADPHKFLGVGTNFCLFLITFFVVVFSHFFAFSRLRLFTFPFHVHLFVCFAFLNLMFI